MKIPKSFQIGGHTMTVVLKVGMRSDERAVGMWRDRAQQVWIDPGEPRSQQEETFVHEVFEAISGVYDLKLDHNVIQTMAVAFHQVLTSSKGALK